MSRRDEGVEPIQQIVASDNSDAQFSSGAAFFSERLDGRRAGAGIHAAGIGKDVDVLLDDRWQDALDCPEEVARVSERRITLLLLLQNRHRDLGEIIEHQIVDGSPFHLSPRSIEVVAPEALTSGDPNDLLQL